MDDCLTSRDFAALKSGAMDSKQSARFLQHIESCRVCMNAFERFRGDGSSDATVEPLAPTQAIPARRDAGDVVVPQAASEATMSSAPAANSNRVLPRIEGYRITGVIGQGGMGIVYRAVQTKLNRAVALKVLPAMIGSASPSAVTRFRREATAAARLHHTNIIPIYDFGESRDAYYYAMELIDGSPVSEVIRTLAAQNAATATAARLAEILHQSTSHAEPKAPLPDAGSTVSSGTWVGTSSSGRSRAYYNQVARWMADAADALHYAHGQGIIHRDIKPGNLILSNDGRIMVADFGLAKAAEEESVTITGSLIGTVRYLSPEQAMARRIPVDHRTDIYSLGATMYELLCFQPAFPGNDDKQVLAAIITKEPIVPRKIHGGIPGELEIICLKTLEKSVDDRYPTARALGEDLRRFLNDLPIVAKKPSLFRRAGKFVRRHKAATVAASAVAVIVILLGFLYGSEQRAIGERKQKIAAEVSSLLGEGNAEWSARKLDSAASLYSTALQLDHNNVAALHNLAGVLTDKYESQASSDVSLIERALTLCDRALRVDDSNANLRNTKGVILTHLGRHEEAIEILSGELQRHPQDPRLWRNLANVYFVQGNFGDTEVHLRGALKHSQDARNPYCHAWRELAAFQTYGGNCEAVESIDRGIECGPEGDWWFHFVKARALLTLPACANPEMAFGAAMAADEHSGRREGVIKRYLALAHLKSGRLSDAEQAARRAMALGDMAAYNELIIAIAAARSGQAARSVESFTAAQRHWPPELADRSSDLRRTYQGMIWFERAGELWALRDEFGALRGEADTSP